MNTMQGGFGVRAVLGIVTAALVGCGGAPRPAAEAPPAPPSPATESSPESLVPGSADEALAQLDHAEGELDQALARPAYQPGYAEPKGAATPPPSAPAASATPAPKPSTQRAQSEDTAASVPPNPCETACRALASMERATEHLCGLAGEADQRCEGARTRVKSASTRVEAQCPRCIER
jgi:hypothetical protein